MYHSDDSGIYGLLYSSTPENYVDSLLEIAKKNKERIVIVYDKKTEKKYSKWQDKEGIELVHADKVQGGE
jgi:hypothetical protein